MLQFTTDRQQSGRKSSGNSHAEPRGRQRRGGPRPSTLVLEPVEDRLMLSHGGHVHRDAFYAPECPLTEQPAFVGSGYKWAQPGGLGSQVTITYSYSNLLDGGLLGVNDTQMTAAVEEALARWAEVAPLNFVEVPDSGPAPADASYDVNGAPILRFGHRAVEGNFVAWGYFPYSTTDGLAGDVHFDNAERWTVATDGLAPPGSVDFLEVAVHEIGHALGLDHEPMPPGGNDAIMNRFVLGRYNGLGTSFLFADDINGIRALYGAGSASVTPLSSVKVNGDFTGDGRDDVATFETRNGAWYVGRSTGAGFVSTKWAEYGILNSGWSSQVVGDFNKDGRDDIANFHPVNGTWWVALSTGTGFSTTLWADFSTNSGWTSQVVGDFNKDGRDDIANFHPSNGTWWVGLSTGTGFAATLWDDFGTNDGWTSQIVGDFNKDGRDDIANFHPSNGTWWVSRSTGAGFSTTLWDDFGTNSGWTSQVVGDFNKDGRDDIANFHPSNGTWWVSRSTGTGFSTTLWADFSTNDGWKSQVVGDYDGDGRDDIANFHPSNGTWWVARSTGTGFVTTLWAAYGIDNSGWTAQLTGDYNGDGKDDIANFHPSNDTWWVARSFGAWFDTTLWARG